jgi:hypothetical protein
MSVTTVITATCDATNCGKEYTVSGANVSKRSLKIGARKEGWLMKGAKSNLCPEHRPSAVAAAKPKAEKKAKTSKVKATVAKTVKAVRKAVASKKVTSVKATPFSGGQSIGKVARSAKVDPAPAAE